MVKVQVHGGPDGGGEGGQPESRRSGVLADLTRDGDTWKVSAVQEAGS
ncbi:hypothetical protein [Saccharomonospora sp. CUA-673]|nr:hypothetical protein [Saccharomonospora sp. CUA-673]